MQEVLEVGKSFVHLAELKQRLGADKREIPR
jgi:hypothetical protein